MGKSKFDLYFEVCRRIVEKLICVGSPKLTIIIESFSKSVDQINIWGKDNKFPVSKSKIAIGLEQGVNELPLLIESIEPELRSKAYAVFYEVVNSVIPNYSEQARARVQGVLKRGKINSESEFYLLRNRLDVIEGDGLSEESQLSELLGKYEGLV